MNRAKKLLAALLLLSTIASAMQDTSDDSEKALLEADHCAIMVEQLDLDDPDAPVAQAPEQDHLPEIAAYCWSGQGGTKPLRESFLRVIKDRELFSPQFKQAVMGNIHSRVYKRRMDDDYWLVDLRELDSSRVIKLVKFDPSGNQLAMSTCDQVKVFDILRGKCLFEFEHERRSNIDVVTSVVFDPSGTNITIKSRSGNSSVCDIARKKLVRQFDDKAESSVPVDQLTDFLVRSYVQEFDHENRVQSVDFDASKSRLATGDNNGTTKIWRLANVNQVKDILTLPESIEQLELLQACEIAAFAREYVYLTDTQFETFQTLPERMQNMLRRFIVTPEQYERIQKKRTPLRLWLKKIGACLAHLDCDDGL